MMRSQAGLDLAEVGGQAGLAVGLGAGDELQVGGGLAAVDVEELGRGLEVGAGQAGVGVGAVLLGWPAAVAVGQAVPDPGQVVLDPFGGGGGRVGVVAEVCPAMLTRWRCSCRTPRGWWCRGRGRSARSCAGWRGRGAFARRAGGRRC